MIDDDILIEAGTCLGELSLAELVNVDHVFITHVHMNQSLQLFLQRIERRQRLVLRQQQVEPFLVGLLERVAVRQQQPQRPLIACCPVRSFRVLAP